MSVIQDPNNKPEILRIVEALHKNRQFGRAEQDMGPTGMMPRPIPPTYQGGAGVGGTGLLNALIKSLMKGSKYGAAGGLSTIPQLIKILQSGSQAINESGLPQYLPSEHAARSGLTNIQSLIKQMMGMPDYDYETGKGEIMPTSEEYNPELGL